MKIHQLQPGHTVAAGTIAALHIGPCTIDVPGHTGPVTVDAARGECIAVFTPTAAAVADAERRTGAVGKIADELADTVARTIVRTVLEHHDAADPGRLHAALGELPAALRQAKNPPTLAPAQSSAVWLLDGDVADVNKPTARTSTKPKRAR